MNRLFAWSMILLCLGACSQQDDKVTSKDISQGDTDQFVIRSKLGKRLGSVLILQGVVVSGPSKGYEDGPCLQVQRIDGKASQEAIQIKISPYFADFGVKDYTGNQLPKLAYGMPFEFEGYEEGMFVGIPNEAYEKAGLAIQTTSFYFSHRFRVYRGKQIESIKWIPREFVDRKALIPGVAKSEGAIAYIASDDWKLLIDSKQAWPESVEGKLVEAHGTIRQTDSASIFRLEDGTSRLVKLEDQVGQQVKLRGTARSRNGDWWFNYRGVDIHVDGMKDLPNFSDEERHFTPIEISGLLEEDRLAVGVDSQVKLHFVVRRPSWKPIEPLLLPEIAD